MNFFQKLSVKSPLWDNFKSTFLVYFLAKWITYLQKHLNSKDTSEAMIQMVQIFVTFWFLVNRVFGSQCHTAQNDDYHDKHVEIS